MATVSKKIADNLIAGKYESDYKGAVKIVKYTDAWGGEAFGIVFKNDQLDKYDYPTDYIINPALYWTKE